MLTTADILSDLQVTRTTLHEWVKVGTFPAPLKVGGVNRWREQDVEAWKNYLREIRDYRQVYGLDPHAPDSPISPPIYSHGVVAFDPRACNARLAERERERRSRTLAAAKTPAQKDAAAATLKVYASQVFYGDEAPADLQFTVDEVPSGTTPAS